ncbi:MAG TPA: sulfatase [Planctomycetota bacterium]|nr:sulfatase [Planctomycetota bacterium]
MRFLALAFLLLAAASPQEDARPSILFAIADDWGYGHAGAYGDKVVKTPTFDRVALEGVLFTHDFCASPSCTPSRAAILTGQDIWRLEESGNLWSTLQKAKYEVFPDLLEKAGYAVGLTRKGWGPGDFKPGGFTRNPAGPAFKGFADFWKTVPKGKPFCYWFGSQDPHRPYDKGSGAQSGLKPEDVVVPPYLPDTAEVRNDILDYYLEVQRYDREVGEILKQLEADGRLANTIVVMTSDNGWPFPRSKANLYDAGARLPLAIRWPARAKGGRRCDDLVSHTDFAPTFLEAAGVKAPEATTGKSLVPLLADGRPIDRPYLVFGRERHANVRKGDLSYPVRAMRTKDFLYIRNLRPDAWPAGDPEKHVSVGPFGDCDGGPTKEAILGGREKESAKFFRLAFDKRPARELYDLKADPWQMENIVEKNQYVMMDLDNELQAHLRRTGDPRILGGGLKGEEPRWDRFPYYGK